MHYSTVGASSPHASGSFNPTEFRAAHGPLNHCTQAGTKLHQAPAFSLYEAGNVSTQCAICNEQTINVNMNQNAGQTSIPEWMLPYEASAQGISPAMMSASYGDPRSHVNWCAST